MAKLHRRDFIISVVKHFNFQSYLEIGLRDKTGVFNHIPCKIKYSVDPDPNSHASFCGTSDKFFAQNSIRDIKWDTIFIDACHLADFVYTDLINSLQHLNDGGVVFLHDVLPLNYSYSLENSYCQSAWKVIPHILKHHPELRACSISENTTGMGVVVRSKKPRTKLLDSNFNKFYEYGVMEKNKILSQNVIQYGQLIAWIGGAE
jgi:hypothetical protein